MAKTTKKTKKVKPKKEAIPAEIIIEERPQNYQGYQPNKGNLDIENPPKGGSGVPPKKIRVLFSLANSTHSYTPGGSYEVGKDVSEETAKSWLRNGVAVEDMSSEGPEETK